MHKSSPGSFTSAACLTPTSMLCVVADARRPTNATMDACSATRDGSYVANLCNNKPLEPRMQYVCYVWSKLLIWKHSGVQCQASCPWSHIVPFVSLRMPCRDGFSILSCRLFLLPKHQVALCSIVQWLNCSLLAAPLYGNSHNIIACSPKGGVFCAAGASGATEGAEEAEGSAQAQGPPARGGVRHAQPLAANGVAPGPARGCRQV